MKKQLQKKYFKDCTLKFTEFTRFLNDKNQPCFERHYRTIHDCFVVTTEGKKTVEYITTKGAQFKYHKKRSSSLRFAGNEISKERFYTIMREERFEVFEMIEQLPQELQTQLLIDYNNFPETI